MAEQEPVVFVGHGSPMNAIGDNKYRPVWQDLGKRLGKPSALLVISAHYFTNGLRITKDTHNKQIFDMYGFPAELYQVKYEPKGDPELSKEVISLLDKGYSHIWCGDCPNRPADAILFTLHSPDSRDGRLMIM